MRTLIFDTETTGIRGKGLVKLEDEPYVIQLAAILFEDTRPVYTFAAFINNGPEVRVPEEKFFLENGLTNEVVNSYGVPALNALNSFLSMTSRADRVVAHNMRFDSPMLYAMTRRYGSPEHFNIWHTAKKYCTMLSLVEELKIPGKWGKNKWPTLDESYRALVDPAGFSDAHDALVDVNACAQVLWAAESKRNITLLSV